MATLRLKTANDHPDNKIEDHYEAFKGWTRARVWFSFCHLGRCDETDAIGNLPTNSLKQYSGGTLNGLTVRTKGV